MKKKKKTFLTLSIIYILQKKIKFFDFSWNPKSDPDPLFREVDPDPHQHEADPKHCFQCFLSIILFLILYRGQVGYYAIVLCSEFRSGFILFGGKLNIY